jgi:hypothetical protein
MDVKRIKDPETGGFYTMYTGTDFEYVNPIDHYKKSAIRLSFEMERDLIIMMKPPFPAPLIEKLLYKRAVENWDKQYKEILATEVPKALISVLTAESKKDQVTLLKGVSINPDQLIAFIFKAWTDHKYSFSQYTAEFHSKNIKTGDLPTVVNIEGGDVKKIGKTNLTDGQLKQAVEHRRVTISKFFDNGKDWHCLFITYNSIGGKESWKDGQPHYHYISDKFGMTRDKVVAELKSRDYSLGSLPHIDLLDYGNQPIGAA